MRSRSRPTEDSPAAQARVFPSLERERPRDEEEEAILRSRSLPAAEDAVVEKLRAQTFQGPCPSQRVLNAWRSWGAKVGRDFPDQKSKRAHADYQHMFARAYDEARQREADQVRPDADTAPMQPRARNLDDGPTAPMQVAAPHANRPLLEHLQPEDVRALPQDREQTLSDEAARTRLRAVEKQRWALADRYDRELLVAHRHNPAFTEWAERQRAELDADHRLATPDGATAYLERLDRAAREGPEEYRLVAHAKAIVASGLVRDRLLEEREVASRARADARAHARSLEGERAVRFQTKLAAYLSRPEFEDRTYCRVEAQRIRNLDSRTSEERERLVLVSAAYNAPSRENLAADWERNVRFGRGFSRDPEQIARDLVAMREKDAALQEEARQHVAAGLSEEQLLASFREEQARIAMTENGSLRKQLEQEAAEKAAMLRYIEDEREALKNDEPTAPMRSRED